MSAQTHRIVITGLANDHVTPCALAGSHALVHDRRVELPGSLGHAGIGGRGTRVQRQIVGKYSILEGRHFLDRVVGHVSEHGLRDAKRPGVRVNAAVRLGCKCLDLVVVLEASGGDGLSGGPHQLASSDGP